MKKRLVLLALLCSVSGLWASDNSHDILMLQSSAANKWKFKRRPLSDMEGKACYLFHGSRKSDGKKQAFFYSPQGRSFMSILPDLQKKIGWSWDQQCREGQYRDTEGRFAAAPLSDIDHVFSLIDVKPLKHTHQYSKLAAGGLGAGAAIVAAVFFATALKKQKKLLSLFRKAQRNGDVAEQERLSAELKSLGEKRNLSALALSLGLMTSPLMVSGWYGNKPVIPNI